MGTESKNPYSVTSSTHLLPNFSSAVTSSSSSTIISPTLIVTQGKWGLQMKCIDLYNIVRLMFGACSQLFWMLCISSYIKL